MSQQTELDPLTPSLGGVLGAWWRPWRFLLKLGFRAAPLAAMGYFVWNTLTMGQEVAEGGADPAFIQASQTMADGMVGMFESIPAFLLVLLFPFVLLQFLRMTRVTR